jgi:hypothetical protein
MKKGITCKKCGKPFRVTYELRDKGPLYDIQDLAQIVSGSYPCPACGEENQVVWSLGGRESVIPPKKSATQS